MAYSDYIGRNLRCDALRCGETFSGQALGMRKFLRAATEAGWFLGKDTHLCEACAQETSEDE